MLKLYLCRPLRRYRVNQAHNLPPLSVLGLMVKRCLISIIRQSDLVSQSVILCHLVSQTLSVNQSDFVSQSVRICQLVSQTLSVCQSNFVSFISQTLSVSLVSLCKLVIQTLPVSQSDFATQSVILCQLFSQT